MGNLSLIICAIALLGLFIFIMSTVVKSEKKRSGEVNMLSLTRGVTSGFNEFVKTLISSSIALILLGFDFALVFGTAALTQETYSTYGENWQYPLALLVALVPFGLANLFANKYSDYKSLGRWYNQYIEPSSKDYKRSPHGNGALWTAALNDPKSLVRRVAEEFKQDKLLQSSTAMLWTIWTAWLAIQIIIAMQIHFKVSSTTNGQGEMLEYLTSYGIVLCTIALDVFFVWGTLSVLSKIKELKLDFEDILKSEEDFNDIATYCALSNYKKGDLAPVIPEKVILPVVPASDSTEKDKDKDEDTPKAVPTPSMLPVAIPPSTEKPDIPATPVRKKRTTRRSRR
jgi:hypothetical protein